jgi:DNA replication protein DnaC
LQRDGPIPACFPKLQDLLEILDDRDGNRSMIITSQLPIDRWHEHVGDPTLADAIQKRLADAGGAR